MIALYVFAGLLLVLMLWFFSTPQLGGRIRGEYEVKLQASPNYNNGKFINSENTPVQAENTSMIAIAKEFFKKDDTRSPAKKLITEKFDSTYNSGKDTGFCVTWLGHSTVLLNINGFKVITDPVFSKRPSPVSFVGTKQFNYTNNYSVGDIPEVNVVVISHDHYDHLDYKTIKALKEKTEKFVVPLGCKVHLLRWGVASSKIIEKDWWETFEYNDIIELHCVPSRHFSGRRGFDQNSTLWCSWVLDINGKRVFYNGDSGYGKHYKEIGRKYGPFDIAFMECGQYDEAWPYIHMMPEESLKAFEDLKGGNYLMPIHWGKFELGLHEWTEPVERLLRASKKTDINILTPKIGENLLIENNIETTSWWKQQ